MTTVGTRVRYRFAHGTQTKAEDRAGGFVMARQNSPEAPRWGFIGLGQMGLPMALSLAQAGIRLTVMHRHEAGRAAASALGAVVAADSEVLCAQSDVIGICVADEGQIDALLDGADGIYASARRGTLLVIHSTVSPAACQRIAADAATRDLRVIDAPVTGLPARAETGSLTIYVGGEAANVAQAQTGLEAMGSTVLHMGPIGSGQITKITSNVIAMTTIALVAEVVELGGSVGISQQTLLGALQAGAGDSFMLRQLGFIQQDWTDDDPASRRRLATSLANLRFGVKFAESHAVSLRLAEAALSVLPQVVERTKSNF
jgi:3-hydroxyisobutyrate dehydrogenase-like beta-hydroxyacid dehydrogenase